MASFAAPHLLMTFHGGLPGGESWSCGLRTQSATLPEASMQEYADYAAQCWESFWTRPLTVASWNAGTSFLGCTLRALDITGKTISLAEGLPVAVAPKGTAIYYYPNQAAVAVTLLTPKPGRHGKGRIYLPMTGLCMSTASGHIDPPSVTNLVDGVALLLASLNGNKDVWGSKITRPVPAAGFRLAIQSRTIGGGAAPITSFQIGDVVDTIRGRRTKLKEVYSGANLPTPIYTG